MSKESREISKESREMDEMYSDNNVSLTNWRPLSENKVQPNTSTNGTLRDEKPSSLNEASPHKSRFRRRLDRFADRTTLGTVIFMKEAVHWWYKLFWVAIFLAGIGATTYNIYLLIDLYFQYPVDTQVTLSYEQLPFPSITVCNINPFRKSAMVNGADSSALNEFTSQLMPKMSYDWDYKAQLANNSNASSTQESSTNVTKTTSLVQQTTLPSSNANASSQQRNSNSVTTSRVTLTNVIIPTGGTTQKSNATVTNGPAKRRKV